MCKLIIRHCALIKPKWCNGFAVTEARALPGLGEGRAASAESNPAPGEPEQGNARYEYERAGNPVLVQAGWGKCDKPEIRADLCVSDFLGDVALCVSV